jgi:hypothetical protein
MKKTNFRRKKNKKRQEKLSEEEIQVLRRMNLGYGCFVRNARQLKMHHNTYRYILDRGYGTKENVEKIRKKLLVYEDSPH